MISVNAFAIGYVKPSSMSSPLPSAVAFVGEDGAGN